MTAKASFRSGLALLSFAAIAPALSGQQVQISSVSCDRSQCPQPVELVNGRPTTISLTGTGLGRIVSGSVTAGIGGLQIQGVTVELGRVASLRRTRSLTTTRAVTVTARGAPAHSNLDLRLTTGDGASVRAPLKLSIAPVTTVAAPVAPRDPSAPTSSSGPSTTIADARPSLSRAIPGSVDLSSGATVVVVLQGTNLNVLEAAAVVQGGKAVKEVSAELRPASSDPTRREVLLTATVTPSTPYDVPLTLRVWGGALSSLRAIAVPVELRLVVPVARLDEGGLFGDPIEQILAGAWGPQTFFRSCGPPDQHRFQIGLPRAGYSTSGDMPRFERAIGFLSGDWVAFGEDHTLDGSDIFTGEITEIPNSAHPSPIAHSVSAVRMCLLHQFMKPWAFAGTVERNGAPHLIVRAPFDRLLFRARGMPAHTTGVPGTAAGIRWGDALTDAELPDYEWRAPTYEILLPLDLKDGRLTYGPPVLGATPSSAAWSGQFLGPSGLRDRMVRYSRDRVEQIGEEMLKVFAAKGTRSKISDAIASNLRQVHGISEVLSLKRYSAELWEVAHP